jgi:hypothetical protein
MKDYKTVRNTYGEMRNAFKIFSLGKPEEKTFGRSRHKWKVNVEIDL